MNQVTLIGRLTKNPEYRVSPNNDLSVATFTLAVDRQTKDKKADFIGITCFKKTADLVNDFCRKGYTVAVEGRIQTGSYEKDGKTYYTTDVIANRVEFLSKPQKKDEEKPSEDDIPSGFSLLTDDDIPF